MHLKSKKKRGWFRTRPFPYLMLLPTVALMCVFTFYPFLKSIYLSFFVTNNLGVPGKFVGVDNFTRVLTSDGFMNSVEATLKYAAIVALGTFVLSMVLSLMCLRVVKGCKVYQTMYALPMAVASVPISALTIYFLSNYGILNHILGTSIQWLASEKTALAATAAVTIWSCVGTSFIFLLVGFRNVPGDLVEAATLDGANAFRRIFSVYVPMASPQIFFVIFLNILTSFKAFAIIKLLTGKGPGDTTNILVYAIYSNAFLRGRFETACVYSLILCGLIFIVTRIQMACEKRMVHYQ